MAASLWVKIIRKHRIAGQQTEPCARDNPDEALSEACRKLDIPRPMWFEKNRREWADFGQTRFLADAFVEAVAFDRLEIEYIDPEAPKRQSRDPRND